jgi:DNA-binding NarL/FixJ family response regulator
LILTTFHDDDYVYRALQVGASGFLLKRASPERLLDAVRTVAAGDALLDPSVTRSLISRFLGAGPSTVSAPPAEISHPLKRLTQRERQVLLLVAQGRSNAEIADLLVIAESTAKTPRQAGPRQDRRPRPSPGSRLRLSQPTHRRRHLTC